jgi:hypothetical protein
MISNRIKQQIKDHYSSGYINAADLIGHLKNDKIDRCKETDSQHAGFDLAYDGSMAVFYYDDLSILIISSCGGIVAACKNT